MFRTISTRALLAAAIGLTYPGIGTAQEDRPWPEGQEWHLVAYDAGRPELTAVPWDVVATLSLDAGNASGSAGCNGFGASYELDGDALTFGPPGHTDVGCPDVTMKIEETYLTALPGVVRWAIDTGSTGEGGLILFNAEDEQLLRFSSSAMGLLLGQVQALTDQLEAQQRAIKKLRARITELEQ